MGADGRNRTLLSPFRSTTGRNQPSISKFIFGSARFIRGLIKPPDGFGLAYVDWKSQEIGIAAALSGDGKMIDSYMSGDPYLAFAVQAGLPGGCDEGYAPGREAALQGPRARRELRPRAG